ncbi:MAG TPA: phosphatidylserine decarboxylase [Blastocatellia bacterium]|nr:phosphatidylserine decarboxylase [Blastocatellia bacterium]
MDRTTPHHALPPHQYVERSTGRILTERLYGDALVRTLYSEVRESAPAMYRLALSGTVSGVLGFLNYDLPFGDRLAGGRRFLHRSGVDLNECAESPRSLDTLRKVFERKIRYWECRPLPEETRAVTSPADARVLVGSFNETSTLLIKGKFFDFEELLGPGREPWLRAFAGGDFGIFRLTPEKYHYNHTPVAGVVKDFYLIDGQYHACNPAAVITVVTPYSKNTRAVTIIETDVPGGSQVGLVAMIEVTALMIGQVVQCYSRERYESPEPIRPGLFLERGRPKSCYRPGSSTDVLIFQPGRISFDRDLIANRNRTDVQSRFSLGFGQPLAETEVAVRSQIATAATAD